MLSPREQVNAMKVLALMMLSALASAAMIGSIFPFLSVFADPAKIEENDLLAWAYERGGFASSYEFLIALGLLSAAIILISNVILMIKVWAVSRYAQMRVHSLSRRLLARYLTQPYMFFVNRHSSDMSSNILQEAQFVVGDFLRPMADILSAIFTFTAVVMMLMLIEPVVATATIVTLGLLYGTIFGVTRRYVRRMGQRRAKANAARYRIAGEVLSGIKDVKLLGRETAYLDRFTTPSEEMARMQARVTVLTQVPRHAMHAIAFGSIVILCLALVKPEDLEDRTALSEIIPIIGILAFGGQRLMPEFQRLYQSITRMTAGAAALERVYRDISRESAQRLVRHEPPRLGLRQDLVLDQIGFTYPGSDRPGLSGVQLRVQAGERIGIVGSSGAGKTTLADIILGLLTPDAGDILVDGQAVTPSTLRSWQRTVGYVPQDIFLIDATLAENIALGLQADEIDRSRVELSARIAQLEKFALSELPKGYDTLIGERGVRLSGGQRQRIGIARALYHNADLIVFDEATSALDNLTEAEVMASIEALPGDKTIMMIAHRLSTVKVCDRILVMDAGRVAGIGTWDELIADNPAFRALSHAA
ncbi:MAG: ABC transporter ATP-binding protein [Pseudomonadota bacterium]